jgi:hypothetical protein
MVEARVVRWNKGLALVLPVDWLAERYGEIPREMELLCAGRRVALRLIYVTSTSARYYVRGAGQLAVLESGECAPAR